MWKYILTGASGLIIGLFANYISPPFNRLADKVFGWFFCFMDPDRFDLTGTWIQTFTECCEEDLTQWREVKEKIILCHLGNRVSGDGDTDTKPRHFTYSFHVAHNLLFGSYVKKGEKGNVSGSGMIQLIVSSDRIRMEGHATWFDKDTEKIESSPCTWEKIS